MLTNRFFEEKGGFFVSFVVVVVQKNTKTQRELARGYSPPGERKKDKKERDGLSDQDRDPAWLPFGILSHPKRLSCTH